MKNPREVDPRSDAEKMGGADRHWMPVEDQRIGNRKQRRAAAKKVRAHNRSEFGGGKKR